MSTSYNANTTIIKVATLVDVATLYERDIPQSRINSAIFNALPPERQELICPSVEARSRGAWVVEMADRLCRMAKIDGLLFLSGSAESATLKRITIVDDYEYENGTTKTFVVGYGFVLDEAAIQNASQEIRRFFEWSLNNIDVLAQDELMGYWAHKKGIVEALEHPIVFAKFNRSASGKVEYGSQLIDIEGHEDGQGPWYFYSWLHSVQHVFQTALILQQHVLHCVPKLS